MAQREQLVDVFDTQQEQCLAAIGGAIGRGDAVELRQLAHRLQGSSASLGASRLSACAQRLEQGEGQDVELRSAQITELRARVAEAMQALRLELKNAA
jgi:HPt (histidine-containing phosphotransfer) domain-containing protein